MGEMISNNELTPEQKKALEVLQESLSRLDQIPILTTRPISMFQTDYVAYSRSEPITRDILPSDSSWSWNQSNGRKQIQLGKNSGRTVTIHKLNPRKRKYAPTPPSFKLWIYVVYEG